MTSLAPIFILGPTGSGKSSIAINLAERLISAGQGAEIVSADAYQIYKGMPILTAAPNAHDLARVPHHLIHELDLFELNDAAQHARLASARIAEMQGRGVKPIVTGGSGLYVKFISHGISEAPPSCAVLRAELESWSQDELIREFQKIDAEGLKLTPIENRRYLVRNLEMVKLSGQSLIELRKNWLGEPAGAGWCITRPVEELDARIYKRAGEMLEQGLLDEVRALEGQHLSATAQKVLGLELVRDCLAGKMFHMELIKRLGLMTRQYAKRQRTWLRRENWVQSLEANGALDAIWASLKPIV